MTEDDLDIAADELADCRWVTRHEGSATPKLSFHMISPTAHLFFETDPELRGWDPGRDAKELEMTLVKTGNDGASLQELDNILSWGPRRMNPAAQWLVMHGYARELKSNHEPYLYAVLGITAKTKRFVRDS